MLLEPILSIPLSLITPFILWPIELVFPYPFIVEEIAKLLIVFPLAKNAKKHLLLYGISIGILFAMSESVIYSMNAAYGSPNYIFLRLLTTSILHATTAVIILFSAKRGRILLGIGLVIAMVIHYLYNWMI